MTDLEDLLADSLHRHAADAPDNSRTLAGVHRRSRRRRRRIRLMTAGVAVAVAVTMVGLAVSAHGRPERVTITAPDRPEHSAVSGRDPSPTVPVPGAPDSAAIHSTAVDYGEARLWLPPSWTAPLAGSACADQGRIDRRSAALTLAPCADQRTTQLAVVAHASSGRMSGAHVTIDGLAAIEQRRGHPCCGAGSRVGDVIDIPSLATEIVAYTPAAMRIARTAQPSAEHDILADRTAVSAPSGWETVRYDGISVRLPGQWPIAVGECGHSTVDGSAFTYLGISEACPVPSSTVSKGDLVSTDGVSATPLTASEASPGAVRLGLDRTVTARVSIPDTAAPGLAVQVTAGPDHLSLDVGVGSDPTVAAAILDSITAAAAPVSAGPVPGVAPAVVDMLDHQDSTHVALLTARPTLSSRMAAIAKVRGAPGLQHVVLAASLGLLHDDTHPAGVVVWVVQTAPDGGTPILTRTGSKPPPAPQVVDITFVDATNGREIDGIDFSANLP